MGTSKNKINRFLRKKRKSLEKCSTRKPIAPPSKIFKSKKDYDRKKGKEILWEQN